MDGRVSIASRVAVLFVVATSISGSGAVLAGELPHPHLSTRALQVDVVQSAARTWARVGSFCAIRDWLGVSCRIIQGDEAQIGAIRELPGGYVEVMTARTDLSYAYAVLDIKDSPQKFIHGFLQVQPLGKKRCRISYSLLLDDTLVPDQAGRDKDLDARAAFIRKGLDNMKAMAEHAD